MTRDIKQQVKESDLWAVAQTLQSNPKKSGASWLFNCQKCGGKNKLNVTPAKKIFKCFSCGSGGKDPIKLLQEQKGLKYYDALKEVAEINNISLEAPQHIGEDSRTEPIETTFADLQLRSSGLFISQLSDRYVSASLDAQYDIVPGDDMVLKYLDVDGEPMTFSAPGKVRKKPLFRVRYQYPEHHKDKSGKPIKYRSPYGSGSALWIPNQLISDFAEEKEIDTLFITEGEKKADKLYRHGIPAVGIMGIHNFGYEKTMPRQFERIIKQCNVRKVIFLLDADYNTISTNPEKPVHLRPWSFFTAVSKFRHYFYAFNSSGIHLDILFGYHKDDQNKGIDDLIHRKYYNNEDQSIESLKKALELQALKHKEFEFHRITEKGDFQLKSYFHLDSPASFFNAHKKELAELGSFKYFRIQYKLNEKGEFEMAQKILPGEQYWETVKQPNKPSYVKFLYAECRNFLRNRNIGRFERDISQRLTINIDNKMVQEIDHVWVQNYLVDFTEQLQEPDVLEKLLSGINQYLGPQRLNNLYSIYPQFIEAEPDKQYMVFKTKYWEITADAVTEHDINTLPGDIWKNQIIDFDPKLQSPKNFLNIDRIGDKWGIEACPELERFDWWNFMKNTSYFAWRENQSLTTEEDTGRKFYAHKKEMTMDQLEELVNNLIPKVISTGFILHDYNNLSDMRAVLCVDGTESEVGKSEGGTGKSLFTKQFTYSRDTLGINGKKRDLESDPFIYDAAKQSTRVIYFDDCRIGMDFEHFFSQITKAELEINVKNGRKFFIKTPRYVFNTNHAFRRDSYSFKRRQYIISFSDYYNEHRSPIDDFKKQFFIDWTHKEWNLYYNLLAHSIKAYLKFGLKYEAPDDDVKRRNLRQRMGENFLDWANEYWNPGSENGEDTRINKRVEKRKAYREYIDDYPNEKRWTNMRSFKQKALDYAEYINHEIYIPPGRTRFISGNEEYLVISNDQLNADHIPLADSASNDLFP